MPRLPSIPTQRKSCSTPCLTLNAPWLPMELWIEIYLLMPIPTAKQLAKCCTQLYKRFKQEDIWERRFRRDMFDVQLVNPLTPPTEIVDLMFAGWVNGELRRQLTAIFENEVNPNLQSKTIDLNWFQIDCFSKTIEKYTSIKSWKAFYKSSYFELVRLRKTCKNYSPNKWSYFIRLLKQILSTSKQIQIVNSDSWTDIYHLSSHKIVLNLYMTGSCLVTLILPKITEIVLFIDELKQGKPV